MGLTLSGKGATSVMAEGRVRMLRPDSRATVERGDIIVTDMTTPDMMDMMDKAAGFVTALGGRTCHAAVVARAMGKACVVGVGDSILGLREGMRVRVDGSSGTIEVLE